ncbi:MULTISPECIES: siderophore-interacting protein [unclassified Streptomyces]|uniref:siderophore-interacting protein n=1 Tax=Streptomyces TaxID=1883 RepID=UPI0001C1BB08|nr:MULTISPECIES: siderophore-interacting protein [unclassified Streptomyces]MYR69034.1 SIP domain-containing protein [Streptomyces sp. SID4939]MYS00450.1 SIP domain-containing protein [Streptomyces sp. SID4940]MYT62632.1 SIP domain-containing protein [Streptomyces sp. SID8357]MYT86199.1 SIP domain-containing protein [Streptomyces sp. SID8360]MYU31997.1 SIP domain-containing protein [Streptomyces sp. SID8358]MYW36458.1 SIP domain-containing protein [Streptomyces sp. SID1]
MAERPARRAPKAQGAQVVRTEQITPHMVRVVLGGDGLADFALAGFTDHYIKLCFAPEGADYSHPFDMARIREEYPREQWPTTRTYTVRSWDPDAREMAVDFVVHGDEGLAGPWAARARPGDQVTFLGPGGGYVPEASADWHLLVGDESALPAIAASLEQMPAGAPVHAFVEVPDASEEQKLLTPDGVEVTWLHRGGRPVGELLTEAVKALEFPEGEVQAFVHGEAGFVKEIRRHLRLERQIPVQQLSISGYWRLGQNDDAWRAVKREWNEQVEREQESAA